MGGGEQSRVPITNQESLKPGSVGKKAQKSDGGRGRQAQRGSQPSEKCPVDHSYTGLIT